ncbi:MAG: hypothetical protein QOH81_2091 [Sphingomonadales bacterium]|jgi:hypothetical protein|nr:hypothetical protein [Sphingomonadales bacterium]
MRASADNVNRAGRRPVRFRNGAKLVRKRTVECPETDVARALGRSVSLVSDGTPLAPPAGRTICLASPRLADKSRWSHSGVLHQ